MVNYHMAIFPRGKLSHNYGKTPFSMVKLPEDNH